MFGVPMAKKRMKLGEILVEWGVIEEAAAKAEKMMKDV